MASIDSRIRPGTTPGARISGSRYVKSEHPGYAELRKKEIDVVHYTDAVTGAVSALEKALLRARLAHVLMHGGHVESGLLESVGMSEKMDPEKALSMVLRELPTELIDKAIRR